MEVIYTNNIPQCPHCNKPTKRSGSSMGSTTTMYFPPFYDENGNNTNPDRNISTSYWHCHECGKEYTVSGNDVDGFHYLT